MKRLHAVIAGSVVALLGSIAVMHASPDRAGAMRGRVQEAAAAEAPVPRVVAAVQPPASTSPVPSPSPVAAPERAGRRHSAHQDLSPLDEIDSAVGMTEDQRAAITPLVIEREAAMHEIYSHAVSEGIDRGVAMGDVTAVYETYHLKIRRELRPDQQARLDEARRDGRVGRPMFVFKYGSPP